MLHDATGHHPRGDNPDGRGEGIPHRYGGVRKIIQNDVNQKKQNGDGRRYADEQPGRQPAVDDAVLWNGRHFRLFACSVFAPLQEAIDADGYIIDIQPHIGVYLGKEKDEDVNQRGQESDHPHGTVLLDFQKQVKQAGQHAEIFQ